MARAASLLERLTCASELLATGLAAPAVPLLINSLVIVPVSSPALLLELAGVPPVVEFDPVFLSV